MKRKLAIGLVHYPINDRSGKVIATNITNFDIHDIARAARVFDVQKYFIIHPMREQLMFVSRVLDHWNVGPGSKMNPMRKTALTMVEPVESIEQARSLWDKDSLVVTTSAQEHSKVPSIGFRDLRGQLEEKPCLLLFGTGFGLSPQAHEDCDYCLEPIRGAGEEDYRHLSVRSAVSICLDRLTGSW